MFLQQLPKNLTPPCGKLPESGLQTEWRSRRIFREKDTICKSTRLWSSEEGESKIFRESGTTSSAEFWTRPELREGNNRDLSMEQNALKNLNKNEKTIQEKI